jgi:hypothetical protein
MRRSFTTNSERRAAIVAGLAFLITFALLAFINFGILDPISVDNDAMATAKNILADERLFRIGIAGNLLYCLGSVVLLTALYILLKPFGRGLALFATFGRLTWVFMWLMITLNLFDTLRLLTTGTYLQVFETSQLQALARLKISSGVDYYYVALLFGAAASTMSSILWLRSGYIPRMLATAGIITSAFGVVCTLIFYINPGFDKTVNLWWFDTPMVLFDVVLSLWLLIKGARRLKK